MANFLAFDSRFHPGKMKDALVIAATVIITTTVMIVLKV